MGLINLSAFPRTETGKNENRRLRVAGRTPAVIYGNERKEANNLEIDTNALHQALLGGGRTSLFSLSIEGKDEACVTVLRELQRHPVTDQIFHVDLMEIPLDRPVAFEVGIDIQGENKLIRIGDATMEVVRRVIEVECLPRDLPDIATIDISEMEIGDTITVSSLSLDKVTITTDPEDILVKLSTNTIVDIDEELAAAAEEAEGAEGAEGEEGEGAEGEDKAEGDGAKDDSASDKKE